MTVALMVGNTSRLFESASADVLWRMIPGREATSGLLHYMLLNSLHAALGDM